MAGGGQDLGSATFRVTLDDSDLRNKLKTLKADIEALKVGPVKLNADGTGTRSRTSPPAREPRQPREQRQPARGINRAPLQGSVREVGSPAFGTRGARMGGSSESIDTLIKSKKTRYKLDQQIRALERDGVNTSKLRAQLGEATTAQAQRQFGAFKQIANNLQFAITKEKDRLRIQKELNAEKTKDTRIRPTRFSGGASESITAKTDAQSRRARLNQQLNSLEASGVKTTKLRAQLGEATTAQARRQFGSFNQIADSLEGSLRSERAKLKIQKDQTRELKKQEDSANKEGRRLGRENKSPVRGGIGFGESPAAKAARDKELNRIARDNAEPIRGNVNDINTPAGKAARNKQLNRIAKDNASPVRGGIGFPGSPISDEIAARKQARLAKDR